MREWTMRKAFAMLLDAVARSGVLAQEDLVNKLALVRAGRDQLEAMLVKLEKKK